ncbi:MAG: hypothetical protein PHE17_15535 [Thiothrix sp.]|uniref:hypothetical protein n=1 Tax=Thiothrix sp. TaxID=1032 RepID=UPI00261309B7|nr:hypothetical protein [Thiothrix sp.]MDD5394427.1 hypothetical protein [Thiothrix sp.]
MTMTRQEKHKALMQWVSPYSDEHPQTEAPATAREAFAAFMARLDWHRVFVFAVAIVALASVLFASYKLMAIYWEYPGLAFLPFLDMHYPLMLFSAVFTANYIQHRETEGMALIALFSTLLNTLLV